MTVPLSVSTRMLDVRLVPDEATAVVMLASHSLATPRVKVAIDVPTDRGRVNYRARPPRLGHMFGLCGVSVAGLPFSSTFLFGLMAGDPEPGVLSTLLSTMSRNSSTCGVECLDGSMWEVGWAGIWFQSGSGNEY